MWIFANKDLLAGIFCDALDVVFFSCLSIAFGRCWFPSVQGWPQSMSMFILPSLERWRCWWDHGRQEKQAGVRIRTIESSLSPIPGEGYQTKTTSIRPCSSSRDTITPLVESTLKGCEKKTCTVSVTGKSARTRKNLNVLPQLWVITYLSLIFQFCQISYWLMIFRPAIGKCIGGRVYRGADSY